MFNGRQCRDPSKEEPVGSKKVDRDRTLPPLSFNPMILGCLDRLTIASSGKSMPVLAGTLYRVTGTGLESATLKKFFWFLAFLDVFNYTK